MTQLKKRTNITDIYNTNIDSSKSVGLKKISVEREEKYYFFY